MVAAVLAEDRCRLRGIPEISDVQVVSGLLELHGVAIDSTDEDGELLLDPTDVTLSTAVTSGGSIGSELCRQVARYGPGRLVLFELNRHLNAV